MKASCSFNIFILVIFLLTPLDLFSKIIVEKNCTIQENENYIIQRISYVDVSPDGKKFLLSDVQCGIIGQFNFYNGNIINYKTPSRDLCDLLALSGTKPMKTYDRDDYKYLTIQSAGEFNPQFKDESYLKNIINNSFSISKYYKDGIISLASLNVPKVSPALDAIHLEPAAEFFCFDNNLNNKKVLPLLQMSKDVPPCPTSYSFCFFKDNYYITSFDFSRYNRQKKYDSLPVLAVYDSKVNFIKIKRYIPYLYEYSKLGYRLTGPSLLLATDNEDLYSTHSCVDYIDFLNKSYHLQLKGLPYSNLENFNKLIDYCKKKESLQLEINELCSLLPLWIRNLIPIGKQIGVLSQKYTVKDNEYLTKEFYLQLYKKSGELIKQDTISNINNNGNLEYVTYNNKMKKLMLFRKDEKKGWTMEVAKWE